MNDLNNLSSSLRSRLKKEILDPLSVLEQMPKDVSSSNELIIMIFNDFRRANDRIWIELNEEIHRR